MRNLCVMRAVLTLASVPALALAASDTVSASERTRDSFISGWNSAVLDDAILFSARDGAHGTALWRSDGTKRGTRLLREIRPVSFAEADGTVFVAAADTAHGMELWRTNGTPQGTTLVMDIQPGPAGSDPFIVGVLGDRLIFRADDGTRGAEPWVSDGTAKGTQALGDIRRGKPGVDIWETVVVGHRLFMALDDGSHGLELWATDGTRGGTRLVRDVRPGPKGSGPEGLLAVGEALYFLANDGTHGHEPWRSDGTRAGTVLLEDLDPGTGSTYKQLCGISEDADRFLIAISYDIWVSDGTTDGTAYVTRQAQNAAAYINLDYCEPAGDARAVYLMGPYDEAPGYGLWWSDGTANGTVEVASFDPSSGLEPEVQDAAARDGRFYFFADDDIHGWEPWVSDGTPSGTRMILDIRPDGSATEPWSYRGPGFWQPVGDLMYLGADDGIHGAELWVTDGTSSGTRLVKDIHPDGSSVPRPVVAVGDVLFFTANDGIHGNELWRTDGTEAGTSLVRDINTSPTG